MDTTEKFFLILFISLIAFFALSEPLTLKEEKKKVREVQYCTSPDGAFEAPCWTFRR